MGIHYLFKIRRITLELKMTKRICELGTCQNEAYLYADMYPKPVAVCFECYEREGFKEY